jgi:hypothetical protein
MTMDRQPITSAVAAERWAVDLLRGLADAIVAASRTQKADALRLLMPTLERVGAGSYPSEAL